MIADTPRGPEDIPEHSPEQPEDEVVERLREDVDDSHDADLVPDADRLVPVDPADDAPEDDL